MIFILAKTRGIVPSSLFITGIDEIGDHPIGCGGFADVWKGRMRRRYFALKILRPIELSGGGSETMGQVSDKETSQTRMLKRLAVLDSGTLPRGSPVENDKTSQCSQICWSLSIKRCSWEYRSRFAMDAPWKFNELRATEPCCKQAGFGTAPYHSPSLPRLMNMPARADGKGVVISSFCQHYPWRSKMCTSSLLYENLLVIHCGTFSQANIMVDDKETPQLSDFGLATVEPFREVIASSTSHSGGNPRWLAPELMFPGLFGGTGRSTRNSDVYAFGMTALEVCVS